MRYEKGETKIQRNEKVILHLLYVWTEER